MAIVSTTNIGQNKARLRNMVRYILNAKKTQQEHLVYAQNCTPETFAQETEMLFAQRNYVEGRVLKSGAMTGVIAHEMPVDDLTQKEIEETHLGDVNSIRENLIAQGKNPDDYLIIATTHVDTDRNGDHGRVHTHFIICRINVKDIPAPLVRNDRDNWEQFSKIVHKNNPMETKTLESYRATVRAEIAKREGQPYRKYIEKEPNLSLLASSVSDPNTTITYYVDTKRRWESIIADKKMSYVQRREALLKCDIDDSIITIKENYKKGIIKELNFKAFLNEMNHRGYSYKQNSKNSNTNYVSFSHKNWGKYTNKKGELCPALKKRFKEQGYTKDDIIARIDGSMDFEPNHATVMVWNDVDKMPNDRKLKKEAIYINICNANRCFRALNTVNYIFGNSVVGLILMIMLAFIMLTTKPTLKEIYRNLYEEDFNKRTIKTNKIDNSVIVNDLKQFKDNCNDLLVEINKELSLFKKSKELNDVKTDLDRLIAIAGFISPNEEQLLKFQTDLNRIREKWNSIPKVLVSKQPEKTKVATGVVATEEKVKPTATGVVAVEVQDKGEDTGLVSSPQAEATGFVASAQAYEPSQKEVDYFFEIENNIESKFLIKENMPNNQRSFANAELMFLTDNFNNEYPGFEAWLKSTYNKESKAKAIVDHSLEWFKNFAKKEDYQEPIVKWRSKYSEPTFDDVFFLEKGNDYLEHYESYIAAKKDNNAELIALNKKKLDKDLKNLSYINFFPKAYEPKDIKKEILSELTRVRNDYDNYFDDIEQYYASNKFNTSKIKAYESKLAIFDRTDQNIDKGNERA